MSERARLESKIVKLQAIIDDPRAPEGERAAAKAAILRIDQAINPDSYAAAIEFSPGQRKAIDRIRSAGPGEFIFVTGKAGTGKSTILRETKRTNRCVTLAPTGLAAVNVGGQTIHSFFRFRTGGLSRSDAQRLEYSRELMVQRADFIIIDEISMVRADVLDAVDASLKRTLKDDRAFGGKTIIAIGDMWQLEPVVEEEERERFRTNYRSPFWFDAKVFNHDGGLFEEQTRVETIELTDVFRQQGNPAFVDALNAIRVGDPSGLIYLNSRFGIPAPDEAPRITFGNRRADDFNHRRLNEIDEAPRVYEAEIEGEFEAKRNPPAPATLTLKVGARVMLTRNGFDLNGNPFVNGDVGTVTAFYEAGPGVRLDDGRQLVIERAEWESKKQTYMPDTDSIEERTGGVYRQYPIRLAWAITAHKAQGATMDRAVLELEMNAFSHGQLYVALSRVRSAEGLYLRRRLTADDLKVNPRVAEMFGAPVRENSLFDMEALA